jgi:diguanylate cyclase (GGDEF)-like protein
MDTKMAFTLKDLSDHNEELLRLMTETLPDMLWVKDVDGTYIYANKAICDGLLMAEDVNEPIGKGDVFFALREREKHKDKPEWHTFGELCFNSDQVVIDNNKPMRFEEYGNVKGELMYLEVFKAPFYDKDGNIIGTVGAGRDITKLKKIQTSLEDSLRELKAKDEQLDFIENHDTLTNLPNRSLILDRLNQSILRAKSNNKKVAVIYIDIDKFKKINDTLGHDIADALLIEFSKRIQQNIEDADTLARISADEFCVILEDVEKLDDITNFIYTLEQNLKDSFDIDENKIHVRVSFGVAIYPDDSKNVDDLLRDSDVAMKKAKDDGGNTYCFYNEAMTNLAFERIMLENALRDAIVNDEIVVYYQPQIDAKEKVVIGLEALARWQHPSLGLLTPDKFIPLAEESGLIVELDRAIMKKAISDFSTFIQSGLNVGKLSLNLATKQLDQDDFLDFVQSVMSEYKVLEKHLEFEVTESQVMSNPESSIQTLTRLNEMGIRISIDDFGTGYSSLAYLKRLPIDKLKIDRSFVSELPNDAEDSAISKTIINLCETLGLDVIAEGVETKEQENFLVENGCQNIQGYLYSRPKSYDEVKEFVTQENIG